ncbi:MAG: hypothetical protein PHZ03_10270 [Syntrophomonas sp.]|nr:hypothetical protein [Syntrophomonas sp.]
MEHTSKFNIIDGVPDLEQIEEWAEDYYNGVLSMMKPLWGFIDINDVLKSMAGISFDKLVTEELVGESAAVIKLAIDQVNQIAAREIEYIKAYMV